MNHILIAVTGASPQVLTETVYALHKQGGQMPEEVFVITTANSKQTLAKGLFEDGHWLQLFDDYKLPMIRFGSDNIWLIEDELDNVLSDAKAESDQSVMADFITRKVAD
ncbi:MULTISPECIES: CRISPR-associated ring nuclease Csm6 [Vibrio]|uniref:CRISPR-associated ring nuclease Csm6 n=1 Tax=Vibrio TaxID=662 RepID=UPI00237CD525|nr:MULTISPECIES: CRISPR-associated ring nuclease Csm6 [Vibrio]